MVENQRVILLTINPANNREELVEALDLAAFFISLLDKTKEIGHRYILDALTIEVSEPEIVNRNGDTMVLRLPLGN